MRAYLDANILLAYNLGPEQHRRNFYRSKKVFDEIKNGKYSGIISDLTLQEILNVLRRIKGSEYDVLVCLSDDDRTKYVNKESFDMYSDILKELLKSDRFIFQKADGIDAGEIFSYGLEYIRNKFGEVIVYERSDDPYSEYKGLGPSDVTHILLAHKMKCDCFMTLDEGFEKLTDEPSLKPLNIIIL